MADQNIILDKRTFKNVLNFLLSGKKRAELEQKGITLTNKEITGLNPAKLPETLIDLYFKLTGRQVVRVCTQSYIETLATLPDGKQQHNFLKISTRNLSEVKIPKGDQPIAMFDMVAIISKDEKGEFQKDVLKNRFNPENLLKTKFNYRSK